jgi:hypothetical protein
MAAAAAAAAAAAVNGDPSVQAVSMMVANPSLPHYLASVSTSSGTSDTGRSGAQHARSNPASHGGQHASYLAGTGFLRPPARSYPHNQPHFTAGVPQGTSSSLWPSPAGSQHSIPQHQLNAQGVAGPGVGPAAPPHPLKLSPVQSHHLRTAPEVTLVNAPSAPADVSTGGVGAGTGSTSTGSGSRDAHSSTASSPAFFGAAWTNARPQQLQQWVPPSPVPDGWPVKYQQQQQQQQYGLGGARGRPPSSAATGSGSMQSPFQDFSQGASYGEIQQGLLQQAPVPEGGKQVPCRLWWFCLSCCCICPAAAFPDAPLSVLLLRQPQMRSMCYVRLLYCLTYSLPCCCLYCR